jgi:hypothetical protein
MASVLTTVDAPYGTGVTAERLAALIVDPASVGAFDPNAFAFFSEVDECLQRAFMEKMGVDATAAEDVARSFAELAGYQLPLASVSTRKVGP